MTKEVMVAANRATWKARLLLRDQSRAPSQRDWTHVAHGEGAAEAPRGRGANFSFFFSFSLFSVSVLLVFFLRFFRLFGFFFLFLFCSVFYSFSKDV